MQVTAKGRFARALAAISDWCRKHRNWSIRDQHRHLSSMMRGHFAYYGVGGNARRLRWFAHQVVRIWQTGYLGEIVKACSDGLALTKS
ncbi:hypothetical protein NKH59_32615 [Mesorhizobium sp. M0998]